MANHCWNHAVVTGSSDRLNQIENSIRAATENLEKHLWYESFNQVFKDTSIKPIGDVYDDFGSKWFEVELVRHHDQELHISGDSAWSPVNEFFQKISQYFNVDIDAEYEEQGCDFGGFFEVRKGIVKRDDCLSFIQYADKVDPGRGFELMMENVDDDMFENFEDFKENYKQDLELLTQEQLSEIEEKIKTRCT